MRTLSGPQRARIVGVGIVVLLFGALLGARLHPTPSDVRLCEVISGVIIDGDTKLDGIAYFRDHPDELQEAHEQNADTLGKLAPICEPPPQDVRTAP